MIPFSYLFDSNKEYSKSDIDEMIAADCLKRFKSSDDEDPFSEEEFDVLLGLIFGERSSQKVNDLFDELQSYLMQDAGVKLQ